MERKHIEDSVEEIGKLSKQIANFIWEKYSEFLAYDIVEIYYDNGQVEVSKLLSTVFNALLPRVQIKHVLPSDYRLFQAADLICYVQRSHRKHLVEILKNCNTHVQCFPRIYMHLH